MGGIDRRQWVRNSSGAIFALDEAWTGSDIVRLPDTVLLGEVPSPVRERWTWGAIKTPLIVSRTGKLIVPATAFGTTAVVYAANTHAPHMDDAGRRFAWWHPALTNLLSAPRDLTNVAWTAGTATMTQGYGTNLSPDGTDNATRANCGSGQFSNYLPGIALSAGTKIRASWFSRATTTGDTQGYLNDGATYLPLFESGNTGTWKRHSVGHTMVGTSLAIVPADGQDLSGLGGLGAGARDQLVDLCCLYASEIDYPYTDSSAGASIYARPWSSIVSSTGYYDVDLGEITSLVSASGLTGYPIGFWLDTDNFFGFDASDDKFHLWVNNVDACSSSSARTFAAGDSLGTVRVWSRNDSCGFTCAGETRTGTAAAFSGMASSYVYIGSDGTDVTLPAMAYGEFVARWV